MDELIADEIEIERKLKELKSKRNSTFRDIKRPEDLRVLADKNRQEALKRNSDFLQELDIQVQKLRTKRFLPLQKKLDSLKDQTGFFAST